MPELENAELIDGVVYMPSPLSLSHGLFDAKFGLLLQTYVLKTPGCQSTGESTWLMSDKSAPQPDLSLYILPEYGGRLRIIDGLASGAPELVVESSNRAGHTTWDQSSRSASALRYRNTSPL